jgi:Zn-dependent protease
VPPRSPGWTVGRIAGAPVVITRSWAVAAVVLALLFAPTVRSFAPRLDLVGVVVVSAVFVLLLFGSVFLHEVAHALVARARGYRVDELALTLWGGHTAYTGSDRRPGDVALVAVVGPLTNLALAAAFWLAFQAQQQMSVPALLLYAGAFSNAFVGLFNLVPGLPLDGGQVLAAGVWAATGSRSRGTLVAGWGGRVVGIGLVVVALAWPLLQGRQADVFMVMWAAIIGAFLWSGATDAIRSSRRQQRVAALDVATLSTAAVVVPTGAGVDAVARALASRANPGGGEVAVVVVDAAGAPLGWIDARAASAVPPDVAAATPVDAVLVPFTAGSAVQAHESGPDLLDHLARTSGGARVVPVLSGALVSGVLDVAGVAAALRPPGRK